MVTMATSTPTNQSEFQLYKVLQRANLLQYYDTFIAQGGDDVQQLCEAGEEEFLEIMALVGMASKPLHVRRLQKTLQEWASNPSSFLLPTSAQQAVISPVMTGSGLLATIPQQAIVQLAQANATAAIVTSRMYQEQSQQPKTEKSNPASPNSIRRTPSPVPSNSSLTLEQPPQLHGSELVSDLVSDVTSPSSPNTTADAESHIANGDSPSVTGSSPSHSVCSNSGSIPITVQDFGSIEGEDCYRTISISPQEGARNTGTTSPSPHACLKATEIKGIADAAKKMSEKLPNYEPKRMNLKKQICREIEALVQMPHDAPGRLDLMRKYGAIYGRFDSKRKNEKPMSLHEISVNEASAQLCLHRPGLLTRREELFPLARDVVRASGYQYAKGHSRAQGVEQPPPKRLKFTDQSQQLAKTAFRAETNKTQERLNEISKELQELTNKQEKLKLQMNEAKTGENYAIIQALSAESEAATAKQLQLLTEQSDLMRKQRKSHKNRYSKHGIHTVDNVYENGYPAVYPSSISDSETEDRCAQDDIKRSLKKTQQFIQESLFDEGLRIAQQYGMADFAEEIKGLIKHDQTSSVVNQNDSGSNVNPSEKSSSKACETHGTSSQEQMRLLENSSKGEMDSDQEKCAQDKNGNSESKQIRVLNIVPLSEKDEEAHAYESDSDSKSEMKSS